MSAVARPATAPATPEVSGRPPPGPRGTALGHALAMLVAEPWLLEQCRRRFGDAFTLRTPPLERLVVLSDVGEIKRLLAADPAVSHAGEGNRFLTPLMGVRSLFALDEAEHMRERKLMLPAFHGERVRVYGELIREVTEAETARWPTGEPFQLLGAMRRITLRVIARAVFGIDDPERLGELEAQLNRLLDLGERTMMLPWVQHDLGPLSPWGRFLRAREVVDELLFREIRERRHATDLRERVDVLSLLLQVRDEQGRAMEDRDLRDELITLLVAGHETTATQLSWTFERVLRHPAVHARLREELPAGDDTYLDCTIKESQRTRPVVTFSAMRVLTQPMELAGYTVPAGWMVGLSAYLVHNRPDLHPNPHHFRPERFEEGPPASRAWLPFGGGVRRCLGAAFAAYEMRVVMRTILERCELHAPDPRPERMQRRVITFVPSRGATVQLPRAPS